jgi:hypothetical protein
LDEAIISLTKYGKIELYDIPQIVFIVIVLLKECKHSNKNVTINIVKFFVDSILELNILPSPQFDIDIIVKKNITNISIALLDMNLSHKKSFFNSCFGKWK